MVSNETGRKYIGENMGNGQVTGRLSVVVLPFVGLSWALVVKKTKKAVPHPYIFVRRGVIIRCFSYICGLQNEVLAKSVK